MRVNDVDLGTLLGLTFQVVITCDQLSDQNALEVDVTNLMANRMADLDRRGVLWKRFSNINLPSRFLENRGPDGLFDASRWQPLDSGLVGPVTLTPLEIAR